MRSYVPTLPRLPRRGHIVPYGTIWLSTARAIVLVCTRGTALAAEAAQEVDYIYVVRTPNDLRIIHKPYE